MTVKFKKWGNSMGLLIPKYIIKKYNVNTEKEYEILDTKKGFLLQEVSDTKTLDELLEGMSRVNRHEELITGSVGKECLDEYYNTP